MARRLPVVVLFFFFFNLFLRRSMAQNCATDTFLKNQTFVACNTFPYLSSVIHWTYHPENGTIDVAYRAQQSSNGWVAWALNPTGSGMIGAQALIAFKDTGSGANKVYATAISSRAPAIADGNLSFPVIGKVVEYSNGVWTIYATVSLPGNQTQVNNVWQAGTTFSGGVPAAHPVSDGNLLSSISLNFISGATAGGGLSSRQHRKNLHGILNAVSWGTMMPIGVIMARYVKVFHDPAWFYLHVACQFSAYVIGVAGWGIGLKLGSESSGITYHSHRNIGISLFCFATLQVFALLLRPNPNHKYRIYWNVYHRGIGYLVIVLSVINIFKGFDILEPAKGWKHAYIGIIIALGSFAVALECITWAIVLRRKAAADKGNSGDGGISMPGYGGRQGNGGA